MIISLTDTLKTFETKLSSLFCFVRFVRHGAIRTLLPSTALELYSMTLTVNILIYELMRCFAEESETLCIINIKTFLCSAIFTSQYYNESSAIFVWSSTKSLKVIFLLVSVHLIMISMVRIHVGY